MTITNGYITLAQFNAQMGLEDDYDQDNAEIAINAASRAVDSYCNRRFYADAAASSITYQAKNAKSLRVDDFYTTTGLVVATDEGDSGSYSTTWTLNTDFVVRPSGGIVDGATGTAYNELVAVGSRWFPCSGVRERVQVTAKFGWTAVPDEIVQATLIKAAQMFRRKDSPEGVAGGDQFTAVRISRYQDPTVAELLNPFVRQNALFA